MVAPLHTYIHALADVFKRPDLPMALPKSTLAPTNIVGNDAVKALLFYDGFTDSLDGGQLIVLHDALSILLFESAIDLM